MSEESPAPNSSNKGRGKLGSPNEGEPIFLAVGRLGRPYGLHGEIYLHILTDFPERLKSGVTVFVGPDYQTMEIANARLLQNKLRIFLKGIADRDQASKLSSQMVFVRTLDIPPLPEGEYYYHQLIGLQVVTEQGLELGKIEEIIATGANDVYVVRSVEGGEVLVPAIDEVIRSVDLECGTMKVQLLPGLLTDD
jgi:16S rRNA processing protein RimM